MVNNTKFIKKYDKSLLSKRISKCVKKALKNKMRKGSSIASRPPYGYEFKDIYKDGEKIVTLVPAGDITTKTVKKIYKLYLKGYGCGKIATYLNEKEIPVPSSYIENFKKSKFGLWSKNTIKAILTNEKYAGIMVQYKWKRVEGNKIMLTSEEERIYGEEFEGIISKEDFEAVEDLMKEKSKNFKNKERKTHLFSPFLKCNECGGSMCYRKNYEGYKCNNSQSGKDRCTAHSVKEEELKKIVLKKIEEVYDKHKKDSDFYSMLYGAVKEETDIEKEIHNLEKKIKKVDEKIESLSLDKNNKKHEKHIQHKELHELEHKKKRLIKKIDKLESLEHSINKWDNISNGFLKSADELLENKKFTREILEDLVEKIVVKEKKEKKEKKIKVYLKL